MLDEFERAAERDPEARGTRVITLQHMERHALRGLRTDAGQAAQRLDQLFEARGVFHCRMMGDER